MMKNMTAEQAEQRETLIKMGHLASVVDSAFEPHEYGMLIQECLVADLNGEDEDE